LKPSTHKRIKCGEKEDLKPSITSLNKTNTCDIYNFNIDIINNDEFNALQKESLILIEGFCIFVFWKFFKNFFCILMEVNKTMYGNNEEVPKKFFDNLYPESHFCDGTFTVVWNVLAADKNNSFNQPSMNGTLSSFPMCLFVHGTMCLDPCNIK
jgi:hypothetical protein